MWLTFCICIDHTDEPAAFWTLPQFNIKRKINTITITTVTATAAATTTFASINRIMFARVDVGAKIVVVAPQERSQRPVWRSVHS